jgi:putative ABC transport system substrate-binding protein
MSDCTRNLFRGIAVTKRRHMKTWFPAFLIAVILTLTQGFAGAQQTAKVPRIGYLGVNDPSSPLFDAFRQGLRELGYLEGQSIIFEARFAYGNDWRLDELAAELVKLKVDVILAQSSSDLLAATRWTTTIPIVMAYSGDPVIDGIVKSLERPGGNIAGIGGLAASLGGKWLELLKETVPEVSRVGVLFTRDSEKRSPMMKDLEVAARSLRVELQPGVVRAPMGYFSFPFGVSSRVGGAFTLATRGRTDAFIVLPALAFDREQEYIADLALKARLPGIFWRADFAEAGGLMSYGANQSEQFRRAAYFVDKILKGAKPAELPIELPKKFQLVINLKTAKEIGVKVPDKMLTWADRIIK